MLIDNSFYNNTTFPEWNKIKHSVHKSSVLGSLFFLLHINDLPNTIADLSKPVLHADDMNMIIKSPSPSKFKEDINNIIDNLYDWFKINWLSLNWWNFLQFMTKIVMILI